MKPAVYKWKNILFVLIFFATSVCAEVNLVWEPSPSSDVAGYVLYYGQNPENFEYKKDLGSVLTTSLDGLSIGDWYFAVTAYNETMESDFSNIVDTSIAGFTVADNVHIPVTKPTTVNITIEVK